MTGAGRWWATLYPRAFRIEGPPFPAHFRHLRPRDTRAVGSAVQGLAQLLWGTDHPVNKVSPTGDTGPSGFVRAAWLGTCSWSEFSLFISLPWPQRQTHRGPTGPSGRQQGLVPPAEGHSAAVRGACPPPRARPPVTPPEATGIAPPALPASVCLPRTFKKYETTQSSLCLMAILGF